MRRAASCCQLNVIIDVTRPAGRATIRTVAPLARIRLLGRFEFCIDGVELPPMGSGRVGAVLAHLLVYRESPQLRQRVAATLWPDSPEGQARTNLRHVLHSIRSHLPTADCYLEVTPRTVRWRLDAPCRLDVAEFEQLLDQHGAAGGGRRQALRAAVETYAGDLLEDFPDEWLLVERERLRRRYLDALSELAGLCEVDGEVAEAISCIERLVAVDPLREQAYRQLMRLHDARGDRAQAIRAYHVCSTVLERELGAEPSAETRAAYRMMLPPEPDLRPGTAARPIGPLVGRARERAQLAAVWHSAEAGRAQFVVVCGEPGVGKTRLVDEFHAWCARRGAATAEARCYAAEGEVAYGPVVSWLRSDALRPRLLQLSRARLTELARLLPELLVELPDLDRPALLPASDQRRRLFDAVAAAVLGAVGPVPLLVDDLQHGDQETFQLLHYLLRVRPQARVLVVATARREDIDIDHPAHELLVSLRAEGRLSELEVDRLSLAETGELADRLTGAALAVPERARLYAETEGNPLFVVEAVRAGWTAGQRLSPRVQAVIETRLAQLSAPARDLVALAATIGREFSVDVLAAAGDTDEDMLVRSLDELWRRRIVRERGGDVRGGRLRLQPRQDPAGRLPRGQSRPQAPTAPEDCLGAGAQRRRQRTGQRADRRALRPGWGR
jgi:DNA-binding SARP family transcriptional activator